MSTVKMANVNCQNFKKKKLNVKCHNLLYQAPVCHYNLISEEDHVPNKDP